MYTQYILHKASIWAVRILQRLRIFASHLSYIGTVTASAAHVGCRLSGLSRQEVRNDICQIKQLLYVNYQLTCDGPKQLCEWSHKKTLRPQPITRCTYCGVHIVLSLTCVPSEISLPSLQTQYADVWGTTMRCVANTWRLSKCVRACACKRASLSGWAAESWCSKVCSYTSVSKLRSPCGPASWRQLTATAKRRLYGNAIFRDFTTYPRPCSFLLLGYIFVKLDEGNPFVVLFVLLLFWGHKEIGEMERKLRS